jgi:FixJ family two-component response regulator
MHQVVLQHVSSCTRQIADQCESSDLFGVLEEVDFSRPMGISPRTVEVHKARILAKADVQNVTQLVRLHIERA